MTCRHGGNPCPECMPHQQNRASFQLGSADAFAGLWWDLHSSMAHEDGYHPGQSYTDKKVKYYPPLPAVEVGIYISLWVAFHAWSFYPLLKLSDDNAIKYLKNGDLEMGWFQGRLKATNDTSDYEWHFWNKFLWEVHVIGSVGHFIFARIADAFFPQHRYKLYAIYGAAFTVYFLGWIGLAFMLLHCAVQYAITVVTKSLTICWITGLLLIYSLDIPAILEYVEMFYEDKDKAAYVIYSTSTFALRYLAIGIEYIWACSAPSQDTKLSPPSEAVRGKVAQKGNLRKRKNTPVEETKEKEERSDDVAKPPPTFLDLLVYQMYFPLMYGGPVIPYNEFSDQIKQPPVTWTLHTTAKFVFGMMRYSFWHCFVDVTYHYIYFACMPYDEETVAKLDTRVLFALGWLITYYFVIKYLVMYGLVCHFSTSDNMTVDGVTHCTGGKHSMVDMWRYFDKGMHRWLMRYIYLPLGGSRGVSFIRATVNSILPFGFVWYWHGASISILVWAALNWLGVFVEMAAYRIYKTRKTQEYEQKYLTPAWSRRIRGLLSTPTFMLMITSGHFFPLELDVAAKFWRRYYYEDVFATFLLHLAIYPGVQSSMEFRRMGL